MNNSKQTTWDEEREDDKQKMPIFIDQDTMDWVNVVAENNGKTPTEFAEKVLRHGLVNSEEILRD